MRTQSLFFIILAAGIMLGACSKSNNQSDMSNNPLFTESTLPFEAPNFDAIAVEHYRPAFETGMEQELNEMRKSLPMPSLRHSKTPS
jgi:peptidyl-dipeptidase Dcp